MLSTGFFKTHRTLLFQILFLGVCIALAVWFVRANAGEVRQILPLLAHARLDCLLAGVALTGVYIWLQGLMYVFSFRAVNRRLPILTGMSLFLRRNLASTFLPMGGLTSLAFFTKRLENQGFEKTNVHVASSIYAFMGIFSVAVVALPVLAWGAFYETTGRLDWLVFLGLVGMVGALAWAARSLFSKGLVYRFLAKRFSNFEKDWAVMRSEKVDRGAVWAVLLASIGIEIVGVLHLYLAMLALGAKASWEAALVGYVVQVLFLTVSPFFRGFGVIEVSLSYVLTRLGYDAAEGIAIMLLFRVFEFWLVLMVGAPVAAAYRRGQKILSNDSSKPSKTVDLTAPDSSMKSTNS
ncbi:MAG: lysylphosphatidylglycerol synthase transmembrane domain-containing protein [Saprospiraceae bacterium]